MGREQRKREAERVAMEQREQELIDTAPEALPEITPEKVAELEAMLANTPTSEQPDPGVMSKVVKKRIWRVVKTTHVKAQDMLNVFEDAGWTFVNLIPEDRLGQIWLYFAQLIDVQVPLTPEEADALSQAEVADETPVLDEVVDDEIVTDDAAAAAFAENLLAEGV